MDVEGMTGQSAAWAITHGRRHRDFLQCSTSLRALAPREARGEFNVLWGSSNRCEHASARRTEEHWRVWAVRGLRRERRDV
jgi:hypothetical protein